MILVFANGKGGVAKSSVSSNVAAVYANQGKRVLVVDLDPQSNQAEVAFGVDVHDDGKGLYDAALAGDASLAVPLAVRDNIDLIAAGEWTGRLGERIAVGAHFLGRKSGAPTITDESRAAACGEVRLIIRRLAAAYDVTVIDTPPAYGNALAIAGLMSGEFLVIPTKGGKMSRSGIGKLNSMFARSRPRPTTGPDPDTDPDSIGRCVFLGVVLVGMASSAKSLIRAEMEKLTGMFGDGELPLLGVVRMAERAMFDQEEAGVLAGEYFDASLAIGRRGGARFAANSQGLMQDYEAVAAAIDAAVAGVRSAAAADVQTQTEAVEAAAVPAIAGALS